MGVGYKRLLTREEPSIMKISCQISCDVVLSSPRLFSTNTYCLHWNAVQRSTFSVLTRATNGTAIILLAALSPTVSHVGMRSSTLCGHELDQTEATNHLASPALSAPKCQHLIIFSHHRTWELLDWKDWWAWQPNQLVWHLHLGAKRTKKNQSASSHACRKLAVGILNRTEPMVNTILRHGQFEICLSSSSILWPMPSTWV